MTRRRTLYLPEALRFSAGRLIRCCRFILLLLLEGLMVAENMDPPPIPSAINSGDNVKGERAQSRTMSFSQSSDDSQTAAEYV
jgi:hypothetical protein